MEMELLFERVAMRNVRMSGDDAVVLCGAQQLVRVWNLCGFGSFALVLLGKINGSE